MDARSFGGALLALDVIGTNRRTPRTEAAEDAYYRKHTPVDRRTPRMAPVIAVVCVGFIAMGLLLH